MKCRLKARNKFRIASCATVYGCGDWSLTLREERRLMLFENRIMRRIFGPKRDANGEWIGLPNEELHSFYRSPNI
jgi:hypothetical protein